MLLAAVLVILPSNLTVWFCCCGRLLTACRWTLAAVTILTSGAALMYLRDRAAYSLLQSPICSRRCAKGIFRFAFGPRAKRGAGRTH